MNVDPILRDVWLACPPEKAFRLLTERGGEWWPTARRHLGDPASTIRMEANGRFFERASDGREKDLGRVREWVEGERVVLDFYVGTSAEAPTDLTITLTTEGEGTRVTIVHRIGRAGDEWWRPSPIFGAAWSEVLAALEGVASR